VRLDPVGCAPEAPRLVADALTREAAIPG